MNKILEVPVSEKTLEILRKKGIGDAELKEHVKKNIELLAKYEIPRIKGDSNAIQ